MLQAVDLQKEIEFARMQFMVHNPGKEAKAFTGYLNDQQQRRTEMLAGIYTEEDRKEAEQAEEKNMDAIAEFNKDADAIWESLQRHIPSKN